MNNPEAGHEELSAEQLDAQIEDLAQKIILADSKKETGPHIDALHKQHEELVELRESMDSHKDMDIAA